MLTGAICLALSIALSACASVPFDHPKAHSLATVDTTDTRVARGVAAWTAAHDGLSGFYPLVHGTDAFGARLHLIGLAERTIDLQYFLMKDDTAGRVLSAALLRAADRGVRIRFLLDDVFTTVPDALLARLDQHENIEVRLYNPVARGGSFYLNFLTDFGRANRRMHNKSFTVDGRVTIVGGRNVADEYFALKTEAEFLDFDVLGIGDVAGDVGAVFDTFWNHRKAIPIEAFAEALDSAELAKWRREVERQFRDADEPVYEAAKHSRLVTELLDGTVPLYPAPYEVVTDHPHEITGGSPGEERALVGHLTLMAREAESEVLAITPYFVPLASGVDFWRSIVANDVRVLVLTNSLASTNHVAVHSAYARYRRPIVEAGVELYESRVDAVDPARREETESLTLHSKGMIFDRTKLFVGSLNLDPRSIDINAEMGIVIESPAMAGMLADLVLEDLDEFAYRVEVDERGKLVWRASVDGTAVSETREPLAGRWRRTQAVLLTVVPERQL